MVFEWIRRVDFQAGEKRGVAKAPLAGSQRPATPVAQGFYGIRKQIKKRGCCEVLLEIMGLQCEKQPMNTAF